MVFMILTQYIMYGCCIVGKIGGGELSEFTLFDM